MSNKKFSEEEIKKLKENKYVKNVSANGITYTNEFREDFAILLENGEKTSKIFSILGFEPKMLGECRIYATANRIKKKINSNQNLEDKRTYKSGRLKIKESTTEEELEQLKHKVLLLEQENEFLKKMIFLGKKVNWKKFLQDKDTK